MSTIWGPHALVFRGIAIHRKFITGNSQHGIVIQRKLTRGNSLTGNPYWRFQKANSTNVK
jgi:hypothetical protein